MTAPPKLSNAGRRPLDCFAYLSAPNANLYIDIVRSFADARRDFSLNLRPSEVMARLGQSVESGDLDAALDQLCQWGNLESFSDQSQASSLEEFYRRHLYFQLSGPGVAALRAIELFHELIEIPASLQSTALAAVVDRLAELIALAKSQEDEDAGNFDAAKASSLLESLFRELEGLTEQAQEFFRGLQATVELREISIGAFMNFKERLIAYLQRFLNHVIAAGEQVGRLLETVDAMLVDAMLDSVAHHRVADELDVTAERIATVREALTARWTSVVHWFIARPGRASQADELRSLARGGIREIAAAAGRIHRASGVVTDRSSDFSQLALAFARCDDDRQTHRLWREVFGLSPARHLSVSDETLAERDQNMLAASTSWRDSPPLKIAPTLRRSGRTAKAGRTLRIVDNAAELQSLVEMSRREVEQLAAARQELLTPGKRLSEFAPVSASAFPLLLDLIGEALTQRGDQQETVIAHSTDGSMAIHLRPVEDGGTCTLETEYGTFCGCDFYVTIDDLSVCN